MPRTPLSLLVAVLLAASATADDAAVPTGQDYGAGLTLAATTPLADVLAAPETHQEAPVLVRGRLTDVCQKKGCWTVLKDGPASVRVRFLDYAFFLPKDATGRVAFVEGVATVQTLSEREARHYAAESRDGDPDAIEGPQREVGLLASGVRLLPLE